MSVKTVELDEQLEVELAAAGEKLVVVYYTATWCTPCKRMKPVFEALSKKYINVIFLKVDVDMCQETALAQGVTAMPTFAFHKNLEKIDVLQGADPTGLEEKIHQHDETSKLSLVQADLDSLVTQRECMNESDQHPFANAFVADDSYLQSNVDAQLIMSVTFKQPVKLHSLTVKAPRENGPKDLKIFVNQPQTLSFDGAEANQPVQALTLTEDQLDGSPIPLQSIKYQSVTNVQIFVKSNQTKTTTTVVNRLGFLGRAVEPSTVGDFKHVPKRKGTSKKGETLSKLEAKMVPKSESKTVPKTESKTESKTEPKTEPKTDPRTDATS